MIRFDFHLHTSEDPYKRVPYSAFEAIRFSAQRGLQAISITNYETITDSPALQREAHRWGVVLYPGIEKIIQGRDVLVVQAHPDIGNVRSFRDIERYRMDHPESLIIAPHPFHHHPSCLGEQIYRYRNLFDAIELTPFYTRRYDPNRRALRAARGLDLPTLAASSACRRDQIGRSYSIVVSNELRFLFDSIRSHWISVYNPPMNEWKIARTALHGWARHRFVSSREPEPNPFVMTLRYVLSDYFPGILEDARNFLERRARTLAVQIRK